MNKNEILSFLMNNMSCFEDVTLEDFCLLNSLESDELGLMSEQCSRVTPLLRQISNYALIMMVVNEENLAELSAFVDEDKMDDIKKIIEYCYQYIKILHDEGCKHPSILSNDDLLNGIVAFHHFDESICDLIEIIETEEEVNEDNDLLDMSVVVVDNLLDATDDVFKSIIKKIDNQIITTKEEILLELLDYTMYFTNIIMLISNVSIVSHIDNDTYMNTSNNDDMYPYNLNIMQIMERQILIMQKVEEYKEMFSYDYDVSKDDSIERINESYYLYKSYKSKFLKDSYKESKLLEKCKKL